MAIDPMHTGERKSVFARMRLDTRPFKHRDFRNLWLGQAVSTIGGEIGAVAVPYQVYTLTHSTALVGLLGLASLIPLLFVPLIGGAIADAIDRRSVLLRTETGMAVVAGAVPPQLAAGASARLGALRPAVGRGRDLQPRPPGDELADTAARARRGDRRRRSRSRASTARSPASAARRSAAS